MLISVVAGCISLILFLFLHGTLLDVTVNPQGRCLQQYIILH